MYYNRGLKIDIRYEMPRIIVFLRRFVSQTSHEAIVAAALWVYRVRAPAGRFFFFLRKHDCRILLSDRLDIASLKKTILKWRD